jgi:hypothetical protein
VLTDVNNVIRYLDALKLDEGSLVDDEELNRMLDPYRPTYPMPYECQQERCTQAIAYWALHSQGARIAPGPERVYRKGDSAGVYPTALEHRPGRPQLQETSIVGGVADLRFPTLESKGRFEDPVEWAMSGEGFISLETNPTVGSPWPLRWGFICPRCRKPYVHRNRRMLRFFLKALYAEQKEIRPGTIR